MKTTLPKIILLQKSHDELMAFDVHTQSYFSITEPHGAMLLGMPSNDPSIQQDVKESGVMDTPSSYALNIMENWKGEPSSLWTHLSTRMTLENAPVLDTQNFVEAFVDMSNGAEVPPLFEPKHQEILTLPSPQTKSLNTLTLEDAFLKRKTSRVFHRKPIDLSIVSDILFSVFGPIHGDTWPEYEALGIPSLGARRSFPSATGLEGIDAFVMLRDFSGQKPGIYYYHPQKHELQKVNSAPDDEQISQCLGDQFWAKDIPVGIFLVVNMDRVWAKDIKNRGYVVSYLEAGHASQNLQLAAKAFALDSWITGSYRDDMLADLLKIDETPNFVAAFIGLGYGENNSIPKEFAARARG